MTLADFRKADNELRARQAAANPKLFVGLETMRYAAYMALVLIVFDTLPWDLSLGEGRPVMRLLFVLTWAIAMAFWHRGQVVRAASPEVSSG
jgi:hypothetical protein